MYRLTDEQIGFIADEIARRGIFRDDLLHNILDHVCCMLEEELRDETEFKSCYELIIRKFYKDRLSELEEETDFLLTYKNYYTMKKVMIYSGVFATLMMGTGIISKFLHLPGAAAEIVLGTFAFCFVFLPLMLTLRIREKSTVKDKILITLAVCTGILISLAIVFKIMWWPGANMMGLSAVAVLVLLFLPVYLVTGLRNPDTKVNTIVSSVLIVIGSGLFLSLARTPRATQLHHVQETGSYVRSEQILQRELKQLSHTAGTHMDASASILQQCESLKSSILLSETGFASIGSDYAEKEALISDRTLKIFLSDNEKAVTQLESLKKAVTEYNSNLNAAQLPVPVNATLLDNRNVRIVTALNDLVQIEMTLLQNKREQIAMSGGKQTE